MNARRFPFAAFWLFLLVPASHAQTAYPDRTDARGHHFAARIGRFLLHRGRPFRIAGANNYYLAYQSRFMVDNVLETAAAQNLNTVRTWGFLDIGNADGSNSVNGPANGVYFHYWNGSEPAFNDSENGLRKLDYVVYRAGQLHLKLILPFVNNWSDFGGMDQYVRWKGGSHHDDFYTDPTIRRWYEDWIAHLLNHVNSYTGIRYKDDTAILAWELANEERCSGSGLYPTSGSCTAQTITEWARDVSAYIKSIDRKHLLSSGSEGFYCEDPQSTDFTVNCSQGVDSIALAKLPDMDIHSYHLYPEDWGKTTEWGAQWIERHIDDAHRLHDRAVGGEWGVRTKNVRNPVYRRWEDIVLRDRGAGAMYWILSGRRDDGTPYPDYDGYTVYCPSPVCAAFTNFARALQGLPSNAAPVADDDIAATGNNAPVAVPVAADDIAYGGAPLDPASIDLDPAVPGQQTSLTTAWGTYKLQPGGSVAFQPASAGVSGSIRTSYTIRDANGRLSNPADIVITVGAAQLFDFEDAIDTWAGLGCGADDLEAFLKTKTPALPAHPSCPGSQSPGATEK